MAEFHRLFFRCTNFEGSNLTVDVFLDEKRYWVEGVSSCGWWGNIDSNNVLPFVLKQNRIDLGSYIDEKTGQATSHHERYADFDLGGQILGIGTEIFLAYDGDFYRMELERDSDIAALINLRK